jgi:hypothetical protein
VQLQAVNALAQLIAAIGVIISLFYLAAQIRQNTRSMRAVLVDSLAHSLVNLLDRTRRTQNRSVLFQRSPKTGTPRATMIAHARCPSSSRHLSFSKMRGFSNAKALWINSNGPVGMHTFASTITSRGVKTWWSMRRAAFAPGFRNYLESSKPVEDPPPISRLIRGESSPAGT